MSIALNLVTSLVSKLYFSRITNDIRGKDCQGTIDFLFARAHVLVHMNELSCPCLSACICIHERERAKIICYLRIKFY